MGQYLYLVMVSMCPYFLCMLAFSQADISYDAHRKNLISTCRNYDRNTPSCTAVAVSLSTIQFN